MASLSTVSVNSRRSQQGGRCPLVGRRHNSSRRVAADAAATTKRKQPFPFTRIAGQEEMKQALILNVIDPSIGGVLIMGDRGTGKSVAVRFGNLNAANRGYLRRYHHTEHLKLLDLIIFMFEAALVRGWLVC